MRFVHPRSMLAKAREGGYAVPALNSNGGNYDIMRASLEAAKELASPVILQVYEPNCDYRGLRYVSHLASFLVEELEVRVPVALQLDHGHSFESVAQAMRAGFSAVMFDASHHPLEENIAATREVVRMADALGVAVEAEVGYVKGNEPPAASQIGRISVPEKPTVPPTKTDSAEAKRFADAVGVTMLAVSVGTTHGVYASQTGMDFDLLRQLRANLDLPLVQHGTAGISLDDLARLVAAGMSKVNFGEPFRFDYIRHFLDLADTLEHRWHPWKIQQEIRTRLKDHMKDLIRALGSDGKGD